MSVTSADSSDYDPCMRLPLLMAVALAFAPLAVIAYEDEPPPAHTGGFGQPTCAECHDDNPVNAEGGALRLEGVPLSYTPGRSYMIRILLQRDGLQRAGFQLASRFSKGPSTGKQAGMWSVDADRMQATTDNDVVYVQQTKKGNVVKPAGSIEWRMDWQAPAAPQGAVAFHVAANASNRDDSAFGDFIYVTSETSEAALPNVAAHSSSVAACPNGVPGAAAALGAPSVPDAFCMRYVLMSPSRSPSSTRLTSPISIFVR